MISLYDNKLYYIHDNFTSIGYYDLINNIKKEKIYTTTKSIEIENMVVSKYGIILENYQYGNGSIITVLDFDYNVIYKSEKELLLYYNNGFLFTDCTEYGIFPDVFYYYDIKTGDITEYYCPYIYNVVGSYDDNIIFEDNGLLYVYNLTNNDYYTMELSNKKTDGFAFTTHNDDIFYRYYSFNKIIKNGSIATHSSTYKFNIHDKTNYVFYEKPLYCMKITSEGNFVARIVEEDFIVYLDKNGNEISRYNTKI